MSEAIRVLLVCMILLLVAPVAGILLSIGVIGLLIGLSVWGTYQALKS